MKNLLIACLIFTITRSVSQTACNNLDFENQNYSSWTTYTAMNMNSAVTPTVIGTYTYGSTSGLNTAIDYHALVDNANASYLGQNFPSNYPGSISARINHIGNGGMLGILERTIAVTSTNPLLNFSYMFFAEGSGHTSADQAYLNISVYDQNAQTIPGSTLNIHLEDLNGNIIPGFTKVSQIASWYYKKWTPVTLNLTQYIGQTVTLRIIAADCTLGGHGGFAFVDFDCAGSLTSGLSVWPGDANYDLTVDFLDLFYVGAANNLSGSSRTNPGISWAADTSANWYQNSLYLVDAKHADCNGNGLVNALDLAAITANYGNTHPFKLIKPEVLMLKSSVNVPLTIVADNNTVAPGQSINLDFMIGSNQVPVDSIFAIGFNMEYPDNLFDANQTVFDCSSSVIGNTATDMWNLRHDHSGSIDLAVCRNDHQNVKNIVNGKIFSLNLKTKSNLTSMATMNFSITNLVALDRSGKQINVTSVPANVQLDPTHGPVGVKEFITTNLSLGPNPSRGFLSYKLSGEQTGSYSIYSVDGRLLYNGEITASEGLISTSDLQTGVYFVKFELSNGQKFSRKFLKAQDN